MPPTGGAADPAVQTRAGYLCELDAGVRQSGREVHVDRGAGAELTLGNRTDWCDRRGDLRVVHLNGNDG